MTWTDIGPTETAAALLIDKMIELEAQREFYERTCAPITAANKGHVIDELFEAWRFLCDKEPLPISDVPQNNFAAWRDGLLGVAFTAPPFRAAQLAH